jgi:hypothetical protein
MHVIDGLVRTRSELTSVNVHKRNIAQCRFALSARIGGIAVIGITGSSRSRITNAFSINPARDSPSRPGSLFLKTDLRAEQTCRRIDGP